jgi:hypothetical protein
MKIGTKLRNAAPSDYRPDGRDGPGRLTGRQARNVVNPVRADPVAVFLARVQEPLVLRTAFGASSFSFASASGII